MRISIKQLRRLIREAIAQATPAKNPDPNCPECHGTGLYTGFYDIDTCRTCSSRGMTQKTSGTSSTIEPPKKTYLFVCGGYVNPDDWYIVDGVAYKKPTGSIVAQGQTNFRKDPQAFRDLVKQHNIVDVIVQDITQVYQVPVDQWEAEGFWLQLADRKKQTP